MGSKMSIIRFAFDKDVDGFMPHYGLREKEVWPDGAYCPCGSSNTRERIESHGAIVLWETHVGLCLNDYERNGYEDSDFFMQVWNPEKGCVETILFATTRGWSYPSYGSFPDATPEVREAAMKWSKECEAKALADRRLEKAKELRKQREKMLKLARDFGFQHYRLSRLIRKEGAEKGACVMKLLGSSLRSDFRIKLRNQLLAWLMEREPKYQSPFSYRQWMYV